MSIEDEIDKKLNLLDVKKEVKKIEALKVVKEEPEKLETVIEQIESPMTSTRCPQSIKEKELKLISKHPENYIEINFIKKIRMVDNFFIPSNLREFTYNNQTYSIIEESIYILPTKKGYFMPTCYYKEDVFEPVDFRQKNKGISGKALSLLYQVKLYIDLFSGEEGKYNLFVVVFLIASISAYLIGLYFLLGGSV